MINRNIILIFCLTLLGVEAKAQAGMVDPTYSVDDTGTGMGPDQGISCMGVQSTGQVILAGGFQYYDFHPLKRIVRLNTDGTADLSFDIGTGFNGAVYDLTVLPDDRVLVAGDFNTFDGIPCGNLVMLNPDGAHDATFNVGGAGANSEIHKICRQSDGKFILTGNFTLYNGIASNRIVRVDQSGDLDPSFDAGYGFQGIPGFTGFSFHFKSIVEQSDGKLLIGGRFVGYDSIPSNGIVRINQDGGFDQSFNVGSGIMGDPWAYSGLSHICIQTNGKIVLSGYFSGYDGHNGHSLGRINADGSYDTTFNVGSGFSAACNLIIDIGNGHLLALGSSGYNGSPVSYLSVIDSTGAYVAAFNAGTGPNSSVNDLLPLPNGRFMARGTFSAYDGFERNKLALLEPNATVVPGFMDPKGFNGVLTAIEPQSDWKAMVGGSFTHHGNFAFNDLVRLMPEGTVDFTFNAGLGFNGAIHDIAVQTDGEYLIGGVFTQYDGNTVGPLIRLHPNGSIDTSYNVTFTGYAVYTIELQPDGKALVGGNFSMVNGQSTQNMVRLNNDGTVDATFNCAAASMYILCMALQADGRILIGGNRTDYQEALIARLLPDGSVDPDFQTGTGPTYAVLPDIDHPQSDTDIRDLDEVLIPPIPPPPTLPAQVNSINIMSDGRVLLTVNAVERYDSIPVRTVFLLNANGTLNDLFQLDTIIGISASSPQRAVLQADDKPVVYGIMGSSGLAGASRVFRLNVDGSLDPDFYLGEGANYPIYAMTLTAENKILAVGQFNGYNVTGRSRIVQLLNDGMIVGQDDQEPASNANHPSFYFANGTLHIVGNDPKGNAEVTVLDAMGRTVLTTRVNGTHSAVPANLSTGIYVVRHVSTAGSYATKIVLAD